MNSSDKLKDIQNFSEQLNHKLCDDFTYKRVNQLVSGGNLFLGKCYAESDKLFITFNPGRSKENSDKFNISLSPYNRYWDNYEDKKYSFWRNSRLFFKSQLLKSWINNATSTFLVPWRTNSIASLNNDPELKKRIYEYSGQIVRKMIDHHDAKVIVVSGVATLKGLSSDQFLNFDLGKSVVQSMTFGNGSNYQCKKVNPNRNYNHLIIFQVPHFSRANSREFLQQCSEWLWSEVLKLKL